MGAATAWFHDPLTDKSDTYGAPLTDPKTLHKMMKESDRFNLKMAIHAIGDRAIDQLIINMQDIAKDKIRARRYRIEHFQHPSYRAIKKIAQAGIIASMQPYHAIDDGRWAEKRVGPDRIKTTYAFRTILDEGGLLTFGSDWPVAPLSPMEGVYAAVTRQTTDGKNPNGWLPKERITVEEALTAYTSTNAYAGFEEATAGTLEKYKRADFVVLTKDPRVVIPDTIRNINVVMTVIAGEIVYAAE